MITLVSSLLGLGPTLMHRTVQLYKDQITQAGWDFLRQVPCSDRGALLKQALLIAPKLSTYPWGSYKNQITKVGQDLIR